jgi:hypothetical protein
METDIVFEPSEFEIIESIEFEEELQRPEELRFFTLEEQLLDYSDKVLPKKKHITRAEYKKIEHEVDRLQTLYQQNIVITDIDYRVDMERKKVSVDWVKPIYAPFDYETYSFADLWQPLFDKSRRDTPNYYPQLITALPNPYRTKGVDGVPIHYKTTALNEEGNKPINVLGLYTRTKGVLHDDGTFNLMSIPIPNTADDIRSIGYYIEKRDLEIPTPLAEHPFLKSSNASKYITTENLNTIFPSIEAIVSHAVPVTTDPYVEGLKYMKVYDVQIGQVPWSVWKQRFPPVDRIESHPPVLSVTFPQSPEIVAPSDDIQTSYMLKWQKGVFPRMWLMNQEDSGNLIVKMIMSKAGDHGLVPPETPGEKPVVQLPASTPDECLQTSNFEEFLASGVYRTPGVCAPTTYVTQEKQETVSKGKIAWYETTPTDIMKQHQFFLRAFQAMPVKKVAPVYETYTPTDRSEMHGHIVTILSDPELENADKAYQINLLVRELNIVNNNYVDAQSRPVVCLHTLSQLGGDLEQDRLAFYTKWTAVDDGFRVCRFCGEQVNADVFVSQDDFDDAGNPIVSHDILAESAYHGESHPASFTNSLGELKRVFDMNSAGEILLYTLLAIFQTLPTENQLLPILGNLREVAAAAKRSAKLGVSDKRRVEGILGIAAMVVLLQTHNPFLIPRRSFGSKIVKLSGFPRDSTDPNESPVLDNILYSLKQTFDEFPNSFKEPVATVLRAIITNKRKVRDETVRYITQAYTKFKADFAAAKERFDKVDVEVLTNDLLLPIIKPSKYDFSTHERFGSEKMPVCVSLKPSGIITGKLMPSIVQEKLELWKGLVPSKNATFIQPEKFKYTYLFPDSKEIAKMVSLGFPKIKLDAIETFIKNENDGIALLSLLNRVLDIISTLEFPVRYVIPYRQFATSLDTRKSPSLVRDAVRGMLYELFHSIQNEDKVIEGLRSSMNRDLNMRMILIKKEDAEKEVNVTRTKERETFKMRMRAMTDEQRDITKRLLDIGIAPFIITNEDREIFAREYNYDEPAIQEGNTDPEFDEDVPEGGFTRRDGEDQDNLGDNGLPIETDYGDYGDKADRPHDDYSNTAGQFDFDEGDGI